MNVTDRSGFRYSVSATPITAATSVTTYMGVMMDANPGQIYLTTTLTIGNAMAERNESDIGSTDNGTGPFSFGLPAAEAARLGLQQSCDAGTGTECLLSGITQLGVETPTPTDLVSPQLPPGASTHVVTFVGPMPESVPITSVTLYFDNGASTLPRIPTGP